MNLTNYVRQVSLEDFGKEFRHTASWNKRLRSTGGRFFPKDGHLDFNPKIYEQFGLETFRKIVRHELCHYHLYFEKKGYRLQKCLFINACIVVHNIIEKDESILSGIAADIVKGNSFLSDSCSLNDYFRETIRNPPRDGWHDD